VYKHRVMMAYGDWRYSYAHIQPRHWMEVSGRLQVPVALHTRKEPGSIPNEFTKFLNLPNPSSRTMALGSTQTLTEMSIRNLPGG
jgi:hypothetical protein